MVVFSCHLENKTLGRRRRHGSSQEIRCYYQEKKKKRRKEVWREMDKKPGGTTSPEGID